METRLTEALAKSTVIVLRTAPPLSVCCTSFRSFRAVPTGVTSKLGIGRVCLLGQRCAMGLTYPIHRPPA
ncbi:hypothetical protein [Streptomyces sp. NPDC005773]|uniref:hypothetical protein n=1 Tax=Streptomyces sp. NPDC005773 TaxID=3364727 RepID=UPI0036BC7131